MFDGIKYCQWLRSLFRNKKGKELEQIEDTMSTLYHRMHTEKLSWDEAESLRQEYASLVKRRNMPGGDRFLNREDNATTTIQAGSSFTAKVTSSAPDTRKRSRASGRGNPNMSMAKMRRKMMGR
jgi:hypothetical protein